MSLPPASFQVKGDEGSFINLMETDEALRYANYWRDVRISQNPSGIVRNARYVGNATQEAAAARLNPAIPNPLRQRVIQLALDPDNAAGLRSGDSASVIWNNNPGLADEYIITTTGNRPAIVANWLDDVTEALGEAPMVQQGGQDWLNCAIQRGMAQIPDEAIQAAVPGQFHGYEWIYKGSNSPSFGNVEPQLSCSNCQILIAQDPIKALFNLWNNLP